MHDARVRRVACCVKATGRLGSIHGVAVCRAAGSTRKMGRRVELGTLVERRARRAVIWGIGALGHWGMAPISPGWASAARRSRATRPVRQYHVHGAIAAPRPNRQRALPATGSLTTARGAARGEGRRSPVLVRSQPWQPLQPAPPTQKGGRTEAERRSQQRSRMLPAAHCLSCGAVASAARSALHRCCIRRRSAIRATSRVLQVQPTLAKL